LEALAAELDRMPADFSPDTIFIGGGTPTELSRNDLAALLNLLRNRVDVSAVVEWTCEANPGTLTPDKVEILLDAGVNRFSIGVQSFNPAALEFLGRIHSASEAREAVCMLRRMGATNINIDLIYGIPGFGLDVVRRDVYALLELAPDHAACYCLTFEDGTPLADLRDKGFVKEVDDDALREQYEWIRAELSAAGYRHYEISNFAHPGRECRHNLLYWGAGEYIGIGPSAHSHWRGERYGNVRDLHAYIRRMRDTGDARSFAERLDPEAKARETLIMSLRRIDGISRKEFIELTGFDYRQLCAEPLACLQREGLIDDSNDRLRLTDRGLFISDAIFAELV
jgi:oxygen-independent coproporphyrinogen-3 oxidase